MNYTIDLDRYKKTVTTLMPKDDNIPKIHRLRPIHLIEIELQAISQSQWCRNIVNNAERLGLIAHAQYGGRANCQAHSEVLNKIVSFDLSTLMLKPYTCVDEDLKANYDRKLAPLGALEDRTYGGSHQHGKYICATTMSQQFHVKTKFGISEKFYSYSHDKKIWGLGQGIGWAGARWTITSSTFETYMKKYGKGFVVSSPDSSSTTERLLGMFVGDTCQFCNVNIEDLLQQTSTNLQEHSDVVFTIGGLFALFKCLYNFVQYSFDGNDEQRILSKAENTKDLHVHMINSNTMVCIDQLDPDNPHKNLGYFLCPTNNQSMTYKQLFESITAWINSIIGSSLTPHGIVHAYHVNLLPNLIYRLAASSLSEKQCNALMKPLFTPLLHAYVFPKTTARSIIYAPTQYAGVSIFHLYDLQGHEKLKFFLLHLHRFDYTGKLFFMCLQSIHLWIGLETLFMNQNYDDYHHLASKGWPTNLWEYMSSRDIYLDTTKPFT